MTITSWVGGHVARGLVLLSAVVVLGALLFLVTDPEPTSARMVGVVIIFFLVMYVGELMRLGGLGPRGLSPVAVAGALCFALATQLPGGVTVDYGAAVVVVVAVAALTLGVLTQTLWSQPPQVDVPAFAVRVLMIAIVAVLYRSVPFADCRSLHDWAVTWGPDRWKVACAMIVVALVGHAVELVLQVTMRSLREHRPAVVVAREDLVEMVPPSLAAISTGVITAVGLRSLDLFAIPLFFVPLVFMRFTLRRQQRTDAVRRQAIAALSSLTDHAGYTHPDHSRRVSSLCLRTGRALGITDTALKELESAALLHDVGQVSLGEPIPHGATVDAAPRDQQRIADEGAEIVRRTGASDDVVTIVRQQAMPYRLMVERGEPLRLESRILKVCNAYDDFGHGVPDRRERALLRLRLGLGYEYDPRVVEVIARVTAQDAPLTAGV